MECCILKGWKKGLSIFIHEEHEDQLKAFYARLTDSIEQPVLERDELSIR